MKTSNTLRRCDKSINEDTPERVRAGKLLKSMLVIFMLFWIILLYSCAVFVPAPGPGGIGGPGEHHGRGAHFGQGERHEHGERHD